MELKRLLTVAGDDARVIIDGSSDESKTAAGWGAVVCKADGERVGIAGDIVRGLDQTSFMAELDALECTIRAARAAAVTGILIASDNKAVADTAARMFAGDWELPKQCYDRWHRIAREADNPRIFWMPSHGKRRHWRPPANVPDGAPWWRAQNDAADLAAKKAAAINFARLGLLAAHQREHRCNAWTRLAFRRMRAAAARHINADAYLRPLWLPALTA